MRAEAAEACRVDQHADRGLFLAECRPHGVHALVGAEVGRDDARLDVKLLCQRLHSVGAARDEPELLDAVIPLQLPCKFAPDAARCARDKCNTHSNLRFFFFNIIARKRPSVNKKTRPFCEKSAFFRIFY